MDCESERLWFYDITNVVPCIDEERSARKPRSHFEGGTLEDRVPVEATVFEDPLIAAGKLRVNDAAKARLESLISDSDIVGSAFLERGRCPRSRGRVAEQEEHIVRISSDPRPVSLRVIGP